MRKVIKNRLINFRVSGNDDGRTLEDYDDFEDDERFMSLERRKD